MTKIPDCIKEIVGDRPYVTDDVGRSDSQVLIYDDFVLKIRPVSRESENERQIAEWARGKIPVPEIPVYHTEGETLYELMTRVKGEMLCSEAYLSRPGEVIKLAAEALKRLWTVDISGCPNAVSPLDRRLEEARRIVEAGEAETDTEPGTYVPGGFSGPEELLAWLENNRPQEDIVLTHGDFCLPNIFFVGGRLSGFIDTGKMGPADRWQDIAILIRTLHHNFNGVYGGPAVFPEFEPEMLLEELGIEMDREKYRYYLLLDEIF